MKIKILYATETGNAEMLAEDIAKHLGKTHEVAITNVTAATPAMLADGALLVFISSTYGEGELPSTARPFHEALLAAKPDLAGVRFAVFGLGDQGTYPETFAFGVKHWADALTSLGAGQIGPKSVHDASGADLAEDIALPWIDDVLALCEAA